MPVKKFMSATDQLSHLRKRKLKIDRDSIFLDYVEANNYFNVINGIEEILIPDPSKGKIFNTENFNDFIRLHEFDKEISGIILSLIRKFESKLKTAVSIHFSELYCRTINNTMQYTNKKNYVDPRSGKNYRKTYFLYEHQSGAIVNKFDEFIFFNKSANNYLQNLEKQNDFIDSNTFYINQPYSAPAGCCSHNKLVVPLWVSIELLDFGALKRMCHYLDPNVMNEVLSDFSLQAGDRDLFLNSLDVINELRNKCAHFNLVGRFVTSSNIGILNVLQNKLSLKPGRSPRMVRVRGGKKYYKGASQLRLYDTLKVLNMYIDLQDLKKPFKKIIYKNNKCFKKGNYDLNMRLLQLMGEPSYKEWKKLFS
ncbi:Abi family protein [Carnobacterium maltaromaticum]|uniref:Abi family protein n=1 Tax=Carnobacterium maltaromaticum TaxID=2751 RepID=UPI0039BE57D8